MSFEPFGLSIGTLSELEWQNARGPSEDGQTWIVREKGGTGYVFRVSLSDIHRNATPLGETPIEREDFPTPDEVRRAIAIAIESCLVSQVGDRIEKGKEYPVTVSAYDLYKAAGR